MYKSRSWFLKTNKIDETLANLIKYKEESTNTQNVK